MRILNSERVKEGEKDLSFNKADKHIVYFNKFISLKKLILFFFFKQKTAYEIGL